MFSEAKRRNVKIWVMMSSETLSYVSSNFIFYLLLVRNLLIDFALFYLLLNRIIVIQIRLISIY
ncbi:hypothetical protein CN393_23275 [Bacillus cereus]|nr:hypothetical protein CN393_23275 [Bacillus cereus]